MHVGLAWETSYIRRLGDGSGSNREEERGEWERAAWPHLDNSPAAAAVVQLADQATSKKLVIGGSIIIHFISLLILFSTDYCLSVCLSVCASDSTGMGCSALLCLASYRSRLYEYVCLSVCLSVFKIPFLENGQKLSSFSFLFWFHLYLSFIFAFLSQQEELYIKI